MRKKWRGIIPVDDMRAAVFYDDDPVRQPVDEIPVKRSVPSNSARVSSRTSRDLFQTLSSSFAFLNIFKLLPLSSIIFLPSIKRILDAKNPKAYKPWDPSIPIIMLLFSFLFVLQCLFIFPLFSPDSRIYRI